MRPSSATREVVGVTGGTSTPIEDLRCVAERILRLAGTPEAAARAEELADGRPRRRRHAGRPHHVAAGVAAGGALTRLGRRPRRGSAIIRR